jgi:peptide/nickel transport system permease protein
LQLAPGDPFSSLDGKVGFTPAVRAELERQFGYGKPLIEQYLHWLASAAQGDFGWSHLRLQPVAEVILAALPNTLLLMTIAFVASVSLGILLGAWQGARAGSSADRALSTLTLGMYSLPEFVLGIGLLLVFVSWLGVLPATGIADPTAGFMPFWERALDRLKHLVLPVTALTIVGASVFARFQRAAMRETMGAPFVQTARAKGLDERAVHRHALRASLLPVITLAGLLFPALFGGAVLVERVFGWPGMGLLLFDAISGHDYWLVTGAVVVGSTMTALGTLLADIARTLIDPRVTGA